MRGNLLLIFVFLGLLFSTFSLPGTSAAPDGPSSQWGSFRGGAARPGWAAGPAPMKNDTLWSFDTGGPVQSSPALWGGWLFIGSDSGRLFALSQSTGAELWNRSFGEFATVQSTPWVERGTLFAASQNGTGSGLFALNATDGRVLWSIPDDTGLASSPAFRDGTVYYCSQNGSVTAAAAADGEVLWTRSFEGELWSSPALSNDTLYAGSTRGEVFALWLRNGTVRWSFTLPEGWTVYSTPSLRDGTVYIGTASYGDLEGEVLALDASTGEVRWRFSACEGVYSAPAVSPEGVFAHAWNKTAGGSFLLALPLRDPNSDGEISQGELLWSFQTMDFEGGSSPLVTDNLVVVGSTDGNLHAVNRSSGEPAWTFRTEGKIVGSPVLSERRVFVGSMDGRVYCIGSASELPALRISVATEKARLASGTVMRISVLVSDENGNPGEGAFVKFAVSEGNLSQSGASTFPDGSQSVKYLAPKVRSARTVVLTVSAVKGGFAAQTGSAEFVVTPYTSSYSGVRSGSSFNLARYSPYLAAIAILSAADVGFLVLFFKRGWLKRRRA